MIWPKLPRAISAGPITSWEIVKGRWSSFLKRKRVPQDSALSASELKWISNAGYVDHDTGDLTRAAQSYRQALDLARQIDSKEDIVNALEDLAQVSVETGKLEEASAYLDQVTPMESAGGNRLSAYVMLTQGMLAAARRQDQQAETLFRAVQSNPANPTILAAERRGRVGQVI